MQPANHHLISPQAFDRKVQLLREVAATLALAVLTCSLHRHIADMSILIQDLASSADDAGTIDVGSIVVHLAQALQDKRIAGAAVDVYSIEPATADNPLLKLEGEAASRLLLTPHVAGVTRQSAAFLFKVSWENVQNVLNGGTVAHRVY